MTTIDKIRAEIERNRQAIRVLNEHTAPEQMSKTCAIFQYSDSILSELLSFLDTLEEPEQPTMGYDEAYLNEKIVKASKSWEGVDVDKYMDEVRGLEPVNDCHDLKKHTKEWVELMVGASFPEQEGDFISEEDYRSVIKKTALHFAEWQKAKMMEGAVEGEIQMRYSGALCAKTIHAINEDEFKLGDKVRIIILPKEDEK